MNGRQFEQKSFKNYANYEQQPRCINPLCRKVVNVGYNSKEGLLCLECYKEKAEKRQKDRL